MTKELATIAEQPIDMMVVIAQAAKDPATDVSKMQALLEMYKDIVKQKAETAFNAAKIEMRKDLPKIGKNKSNSQTNSKYVDLEKIKDAIDPVLSKHGFDVHYENYFPADKIGVTCILSHVQGHSQRNSVELPADGSGIKGTANKTPVHAIASSITYAERYALCGLLGINTGDNDGQSINDKTAVISPEQVVEINGSLTKIADAKYSAQFLTYMKVQDVAEILAIDHNKAMVSIKAKIGNGVAK